MVNMVGSSARPGTGRTPHRCGELREHTVRVPRWLFTNFRTLRRSTVSLPRGPTPIFVKAQCTAISRKPNLKNATPKRLDAATALLSALSQNSIA